MNKDLTKTAKLYKEVRDLLGLSQAQFAKTLGISKSHLWKIENEGRDPRGSQVMEVMEIRKRAIANSPTLR